jgi:hypothetical protein
VTLRLAAMGLSTGFAAGAAATAAAQAEDPACFLASDRFIGADWRPQVTALRDGPQPLESRLPQLVDEALADLHAQLAGRLRAPVPVAVRLCLAEPDPAHGLPPDRLMALGRALAAQVAANLAAGGLLQGPEVLTLTDGVTGPVTVMAGATQPTLIIAADSLADPARLQPLSDAGRLFTDETQWGLIPGEGAGAILLAPTAAFHDPRLMGDLSGAALADEPVTEAMAQDSTHPGLSDAAQAALHSHGGRVGVVFSDWNNSRYKAGELGYCLQRIAARHLTPEAGPDYPSLAFGDTGAAYLPHALFLACLPAGQVARPALIVCGAAGPARGAVVVTPQTAY